MNKTKINAELKKLYARHLKSMNKDELWEITREILFLKIALGRLKKHRKQKISELSDQVIGDEGECFITGIANIYPFTVLLMGDSGNAHDSIRKILSDISPFLNEAEQMLFKVAFCEEHCQSEEVEEPKKKVKAVPKRLQGKARSGPKSG